MYLSNNLGLYCPSVHFRGCKHLGAVQPYGYSIGFILKLLTANYKLTLLAFSCFGEFLDVGDDFVDRFGA